MKIDEQRKKHPKLVLEETTYAYEAGNLTLAARFKLTPNLEFFPEVTIHGVSREQYEALGKSELETYAFNLGLAEIFTYWKASVPAQIEIIAGPISPHQIEFWHKLLIGGMGEFFYVNQIDFTAPDFVKIFASSEDQSSTPAVTNPITPSQTPSGCLLPLGGGKDSLVALELLKNELGEKPTLFALNPVAAVAEIKALNPDLELITATRRIDPTLLRLNGEGYFNGHTPFSAYLAFLTTFIARIFNLKYVVISNERSSNEESVTYLDRAINHQYSKSFTFEADFEKYRGQYLPPGTPQYFSLLRPLFELQIGKLFSELPAYFQIFKSCNRHQRQNNWCGECSKCLFAYLILYPFLDEATMISIFGINLLDNGSLWSTTKELIGYSHQKPLDCVGTHEESLVALFLCYQKDKQYNKQLSKLSEFFETEVLPHEADLAARVATILGSWNNEHLLPAQFDRMMKYVHERTFITGK